MLLTSFALYFASDMSYKSIYELVATKKLKSSPKTKENPRIYFAF